MVSQQAILEASHRLSPRQFEHLIAQLFEAQEYRLVVVQGGADDRGVDITCPDGDVRLVAVQCKRFAPTTTVNAMTVQHLVGMVVTSKAHRAMLVTTGGFTTPAQKQEVLQRHNDRRGVDARH